MINITLVIAINASEGMVLAAESRDYFTRKDAVSGEFVCAPFDNGIKLFSFKKPHNYIGILTFGVGVIGSGENRRTVENYMFDFESKLPRCRRLSVSEFVECLKRFFTGQWEANMPQDSSASLGFFVCGFDNEKSTRGRLFVVTIASKTNGGSKIEESSFNQWMRWAGQGELVDRIVLGYDARMIDRISETLSLDANKKSIIRGALGLFEMFFPYNEIPLQDCINLAKFLIQTTIRAQEVFLMKRGCGGPIDIAVITRMDGLRYVQRKD